MFCIQVMTGRKKAARFRNYARECAGARNVRPRKGLFLARQVRVSVFDLLPTASTTSLQPLPLFSFAKRRNNHCPPLRSTSPPKTHCCKRRWQHCKSQLVIQHHDNATVTTATVTTINPAHTITRRRPWNRIPCPIIPTVRIVITTIPWPC